MNSNRRLYRILVPALTVALFATGCAGGAAPTLSSSPGSSGGKADSASALPEETAQLIWETTPGGGPIQFAPDGTSVGSALAGGDPNLSADQLAVADGSLVRGFPRVRGGNAVAVAFSPDGALFAVGINGFSPNLTVFRTSDGTAVWGPIIGHPNGTLGVAFSPDGTLLATTGSDRMTKLWQASNGTLLQTFADGFEMAAVAYSPDASLIASGNTGVIHLWNAADGTLVNTISNAGAANTLAFSADGETIATGTALFQVASGALVQSFPWPSPNGSAIAVAFSGDGTEVITAGEDFQYPTVNVGAIRFWEVSSGTLRLTYHGETGTQVNSVAVSPDGRSLSYGFTDSARLTTATVLAQYPF